MSGRYSMTTKEIIKIDGRYIDVDQIATVGPIQEYKEGVFMFEIMMNGHSNTIVVEAASQIEINCKQIFVVEHWSCSDDERVHQFDMDEFNEDDLKDFPDEENDN